MRQSQVAEHMRLVEETGDGQGIPSVFRDGVDLFVAQLGAIWRDVKDCTYCGKRYVAMHAAMVPDWEPGVGRSLRLVSFDLCRPHDKLFRELPSGRTG